MLPSYSYSILIVTVKRSKEKQWVCKGMKPEKGLDLENPLTVVLYAMFVPSSLESVKLPNCNHCYKNTPASRFKPTEQSLYLHVSCIC